MIKKDALKKHDKNIRKFNVHLKKEDSRIWVDARAVNGDGL